MASRRFRIKPTANVPIRRGKINVNGEKPAEENGIGSVVGSIELKQELSPDAIVEPSTNSNSSDYIPPSIESSSDSNSSHSNLENVSHTPPASSDTQNATVKVENESSASEGENKDETSKESITSKTTVPGRSVIPPGLVRKRMKPAVSIAAVNRRPRDINKTLNDTKLPENAATQNDTASTKEADKEISVVLAAKVEQTSEKIVAPCFEQMDKEMHFSSSKDVSAEVPGVGKVIPTGTAVRPLHDSINRDSTPILGKGEDPKSMPEPDLPSEGAGGENSLSLKPRPQVTIPQRSRFVKPTPRIEALVRVRKNSTSLDSAPSAEFSVSNKSFEVITPEIRDDSKAYTSESDDESKKCVSDASTVSPPKKLLEGPRGRFSKPTPRFMEASARRNSMQGSASESEDECRKSLSVASTVTPPNKRHADLRSEEASDVPTRDETLDESEKKLRTRRAPSSAALRLAKARQEFMSKFGNKTPDRSKLTMIDLIFYNPVSNPMKSAEVDVQSRKSISLDEEERVIEERLQEEEVDDPTVQEANNNGNDDLIEEDVAMPVPQVKVGPDGQIILDEQSLVIETTGAKKNREDLANSAVVIDYGLGSAGYSTYSKNKKKSKEWSKRETLKFYRALNTVGTDFLLMQTIFPKRSRHDLKMKFKKEDRMNRYLVEKALRNPLDFDLTELEKEVEIEEKLEAEEQLRKKQEVKLARKPKMKKESKEPKAKKSRKRSFTSKELDSTDTREIPCKENKDKKEGKQQKEKQFAKNKERNYAEKEGTDGKKEIDNAKIETSNAKKEKQKRKQSRKQHSKEDSESSSSDENDEYDDINYDIDPSKELMFNIDADEISNINSKQKDRVDDHNYSSELNFLAKPPKPTRYGRIPQRRKLNELEEEEAMQPSKRNSKPLTDITKQPSVPDFSNVEPGSLVVLATPDPADPSHHIYKVFMVPPNSGNIPNTVPLPTSENERLTTSLPSEIPEHNFTLQHNEDGDHSEHQKAEFLPQGALLPVQAEHLTSQLNKLLPIQMDMEVESDQITHGLDELFELEPAPQEAEPQTEVNYMNVEN